jgi:hypothetical protein
MHCTMAKSTADDYCIKLQAHDAEQRAVIERQAQEIAEYDRKLRELCAAHGLALIQLHDQAKELAKLREALREISMGKGAYSDDRLEHAANTIDDMKRLALQALTPTEET